MVRNVKSATNGLFIFGAILLLVVQCLTGCGETKLRSRWLDRDIAVDGWGSEWRGCEAYRDDENGVRIGFFNDGEELYVFVSTMNTRTQVQILARGFTVWFDPEGGKDEVFGIRYPVHRELMDRAEGDHGRWGSGPPGDGRPEMNPEVIQKMLKEARDELEVIGPGKGSVLAMSVEEARSQGIDVMIDMTNRVLEYELRIPLTGAPNPLYVLGAAPGDDIGIGFETGSFDGRRPYGFPHVRMSGRGFPGGVRPGGIGGGMPGSMRRPPMTERLEFWAKVALAAGPGDRGNE